MPKMKRKHSWKQWNTETLNNCVENSNKNTHQHSVVSDSEQTPHDVDCQLTYFHRQAQEKELNHAKTDYELLHMASSYLILYACYTAADFSFIIRRNCRWYSSEIHISCLKVLCGNLSYLFREKKHVVSNTGTQRFPEVSIENYTQALTFSPYSSHKDTEMTASRLF